MHFLQSLWWWIEVHTGTVNESGPFYGFWSGFGSDLGELTIIGGIVAAGRHVNCHEKGCWRPGHKVEGSPLRACHKHHPTHPRKHRNGSVKEMHQAHVGSPDHNSY